MKALLGTILAGLVGTGTFTAVAQGEEVLARARMPSAADAQAEVTLLRRDGAAVVETLVYSRVLRRVAAEIREKELRNWPEGKTGHEDSTEYVAALEATANDVWHAFLQRDDRRERHQSLLIEFVLGTGAERVSFYLTHVRENGDSWEVVDRRLARTIEPARAYVQANMALIVADTFGGDDTAAARRLDELIGSFEALEE
jgi:hypothetical protein